MGNRASIGRELRADLSRTVRDAMLRAADAVTAATPVDTTHARNNWILSKGSPVTDVDGSPEAPSTAMQEAGKAAIASYDVGKDGAIYLRNNVAYTRFLDNPGTSPQAEAGFVMRAFVSAAEGAAADRQPAVTRLLTNAADAAFRKGL